MRGLQSLRGCFLQGIDRWELRGKHLCHSCADVTNGETEQHLVIRLRLAPLDRIQEVLRALLSPALECDNILLLPGERVQISDVSHQPERHKLLHGGLPESLDVERGTRGKMLDPSFHLRRARGVFTEIVRLSLGPVNPRTADRTHGGHREALCPCGTPPGDDTAHFRDDIPSLLYDNNVPHTEIQLTNVINVVECCAGNGCAAKEHGFQLGNRRHRAGAANLEGDARELRLRLSRCELESDGPTRAPRDRAKDILLPQIIDFDDHPVNVVRQ